MGFLDFFSGKPTDSAILAQVQKAKERYAQPDYRRMAMDKLLKWDTEASLAGLLQRLTVVVQSPQWDEEEKLWVVEQMVSRGERALPILQKFIAEHNEVNHALMALKKIVDNSDIYSQYLLSALKHRLASDHRSVQAKQEIIAALTELNRHDFDEILAPYLYDHSDEVQCLVIDSLAESPHDKIKQDLISLLSSETHSARVLRRVASILAQQKISITPDTKLAEAVREEFSIKNGVLSRA